MRSLGVVLALGFLAAAANAEFIIESPRVTDWGEWGRTEYCPTGTYVSSFRIKVEEDQGSFADDSALNAIELFCSDGRTVVGSVTSTVGDFGFWTTLYECSAGRFMDAFQLRSEEDQGGFDDTAANNLRMRCSDGAWIEADGTSWGDWTYEQRCPQGYRIVGIRTQVEEWQEGGDDTALNNVDFVCGRY